MRIVGSGLIIAAYFITLNLDVVTGVAVHLTAMIISVPYFIKSKAWDVVIMMTFLMTIGTGRLVTAAIRSISVKANSADIKKALPWQRAVLRKYPYHDLFMRGY